jgi:hypothetical protein
MMVVSLFYILLTNTIEFGFDIFSINNENIVIWHAKDDGG